MWLSKKMIQMNLQNRERLTDLENNLWLPVHTAVFKMDKQHGPTVQHKELCSMLCGGLNGRWVSGRMGLGICMTESLHCSPETHISAILQYKKKS